MVRSAQRFLQTLAREICRFCRLKGRGH